MAVGSLFTIIQTAKESHYISASKMISTINVKQTSNISKIFLFATRLSKTFFIVSKNLKYSILEIYISKICL